MKRFIFAVLVAMGVAVAATAQDVSALGEAVKQVDVDVTEATTKIHFPAEFELGKWKDAKWGALWEFSSNNIVLSKDGNVVCSFEGKVKNYNITVGTKGLVVSFDCDATKRSYKITKPIAANTDLELDVVRHDVPDSDPNKHWNTSIIRQ
ncbi:MAG: hypothetical protein KBS64_00950 [Treponema sp.]|nr:hypothetical protein [Candidatus Treponema equi]